MQSSQIHAWDCPCGTRNAPTFPKCRKCERPINQGRAVFASSGTSVSNPRSQQEAYNLAEWWGKLPGHWKFGLACGVVAFVLMRMSPSTPSGQGNADAALYVAEKAVKATLLSPATAKFDLGHAKVFKRGEVGWTVKGDVDAQNAFGALLRQDYLCEMNYRPADGKYEVTAVYLGGEKQSVSGVY